MGEHDVHDQSDEREVREFTRRMLADIVALEAMLEGGMIESGIRAPVASCWNSAFAGAKSPSTLAVANSSSNARAICLPWTSPLSRPRPQKRLPACSKHWAVIRSK